MKFNKGKIIGSVVGVAIMLFGGKFVYDNFINDDNPYQLTYITIEGNNKEKEQIDAINEVLKDKKVDETSFNMLKTDNEDTVVMNVSEYNKLAKKNKLKEVSVADNESIIIPRYDGIKNKKYTNEQKAIKEFKIKEKTLKVSGLVEKKILVNGLFKNQLIVSDKTYDELSKGSKKVQVKAYNYKSNKEIENNILKLRNSKLFPIENQMFYLIS